MYWTTWATTTTMIMALESVCANEFPSYVNTVRVWPRERTLISQLASKSNDNRNNNNNYRNSTSTKHCNHYWHTKRCLPTALVSGHFIRLLSVSGFGFRHYYTSYFVCMCMCVIARHRNHALIGLMRFSCTRQPPTTTVHLSTSRIINPQVSGSQPEGRRAVASLSTAHKLLEVARIETMPSSVRREGFVRELINVFINIALFGNNYFIQ